MAKTVNKEILTLNKLDELIDIVNENKQKFIFVDVPLCKKMIKLFKLEHLCQDQ